MHHALSYLPPKDDGPFEKLCRVAEELFGARQLRRFGRRGQTQCGIDLIGRASDEMPIGVQCKVRSKGKLSPTDIATDIEAARMIEPRLGHFVIATTAPKDASLQLEVFRLDDESRALGSFAIRIYFWDDLCEFFDDHPDIARKINLRLGTADVDRIETHLVELKCEMKVVARHFEAAAGTSTSEADQRIDDAYRQACDGHPRAAIAILDQMRKVGWDRLDDRLRFRVLANLGSAHAMLGDLSTASDMQMQARLHHTSQRSRELEAIAWHWRGDQARALQLAEQLLRDAPGSVVAHTVRIAAQVDKLTVDQALALVPSELHGESHIQGVMSTIAQVNGELDRAIAFARGALKGASDWISATIELATLQIRQHAASNERGEPGNAGSNWALEVEHILTALIERVGESGTTPELHRARFLRSLARRRLAKLDAADEDLRIAHRGLPSDPSISASWALLLTERGQLAEAIRVLEAVTEPRALRFYGLWAQTLLDRNEPGDRSRAADILLTALADSAEKDLNDLFICAKLLSDALVGAQRETEALALLADDGPLSHVAQSLRRTLRAHVLLAIRRHDEAIVQLRGGTALDVAGLPIPTRKLALQCLAKLEMWREIHDALVGLDDLTKDGSLASYFIEAAAACGEDEALLSFLERRSPSMPAVRSHVRIETGTLFAYGEHDAGIARLTRWLEDHPEDTEARLWRSCAALDAGRSEFVQAGPEYFPDPRSCHPELGLRIVQFWGASPDPDWVQVERFAYALWRWAPDNIDTCNALIVAHFLAVSAKWTPEPLAEVCLDCSVHMRFPNGEDLWATFESESPGPRPHHYGPEHEVTGALMGARIGENRELPSGLLGPKRVTVERIVRPLVYHSHELASSWERRFPSRHVVSMMRMPSPPREEMTPEEAGVHLAELKAAVRNDAEQRQAREEKLAERSSPRHLLGEVLGKSVFAATAYLAGRPDRQLFCSTGTLPERQNAERAIQRSRAVMVDVTALATLAALGRLPLLAKLRIRLVTTQSTIIALRQHVRETSICGEMCLAWHDGDMVVLRDDPEARGRHLAELRAGLATLQASAEVVGGRALASQPPKVREALEGGFGRAGAQAAATAAKLGIPLWTDDLFVAHFAKRMLGTESIWTAQLLQVAQSGGDLAQEEVDAVLGQLYALGYRNIALRSSTVTNALLQANWMVDAPLVKALLESFSDPEINQRSMLEYAMGALLLVWSACPLLESRTAIARATLRSLDARPDGRVIGAVMLRAVGAAFGLNVVAASEVQSLLSSWLASPRPVTLNRTLLLGPDGSPI